MARHALGILGTFGEFHPGELRACGFLSVGNGRADKLGNGFPEMGVGRREPIREISGQMPAGPASVGRRKKRVSGLSDWREVGLDKTNHHSMSQVCDTSHFSNTLSRLFFKPHGHPGGRTRALGYGKWSRPGTWEVEGPPGIGTDRYRLSLS